MIRAAVSILAGLLAAIGPASSVPVSLSGSPASMQRQHRVAVESGFPFLRTPADVRAAVAAGELIPVRGNRHYAPKYAGESVARPEVKHFIERFSADYHATCGERLVVTSLTRPHSRQPRNAHPLSVHPAGMAMDLRVPRSPGCRRWFETTLLELERRGVLDVTREQRPAHYHVALFPDAYLAHAGLAKPVQVEVVQRTAPAAAAEIIPVQPPRNAGL